MVVACLITMALGVGHVFVRHEVIRLAYELSQASDELQKSREEHHRLLLEKAVLTAPDRIETLSARLGMAQPTEDQIRVVRVRRGTLGTPKSPSRFPVSSKRKQPHLTREGHQ